MSLFGVVARLVVAVLLFLPLRLALGAERRWIALLAALALSFTVFLIVGRLVKRLFLMPFRMKSETMTGCVVEVHSLRRTEVPEPDEDAASEGGDEDEDDEESQGDEDDESLADRTWFELDATFSPREPGAQRALPHWEPGELGLVPPDRDVSPSGPTDGADEVGVIRRIHYFDEGAWKVDDGMKFVGPMRLRLQLGVKPDTPKVALRYYFEKLAILELPR